MATVKPDHPVAPGTPRWQELVSQSQSLTSVRNWFLGDASLEVMPAGTRFGAIDEGIGENLRLFAAEVGIPYNSIRAYRAVAAAWPPEERVASCTWSVHQVLMSCRGLIEPGMDKRAAVTARQRHLECRSADLADSNDVHGARVVTSKECVITSSTSVRAASRASSPSTITGDASLPQPRAATPAWVMAEASQVAARLDRASLQVSECLAWVRKSGIQSDSQFSLAQDVISAAAQQSLRRLIPVLRELAEVSNRPGRNGYQKAS